MKVETIPLKVISSSPNATLAEVQVSVDGKNKFFLLDTGAASSSIGTDDHTKQYRSLGKEESRGASGNPTICDIIQPSEIKLGKHVFSKTKLKRCDRFILGIDLLGEQIFEVYLAAQELNILAELPNKNTALPVRRLKPGHLTIPAKLGGLQVDVLFDTGADTTVIDAKFVRENPTLFTLVRSEDGTDAHGNKIPSEVYRCSVVELGNLRLSNVEMATFEFGDHLREKMEGSPVILGNNVISKAVWSFDLKSGKWVSQPLPVK